VLTRAGHTEAGCDLARLPDVPAAMIVEILNDDGTMARRRTSSYCEIARPQDRHHRGSHSLSPEERALGGTHLRGDRRDRIRRFQLFCYEDHVNKTVHIALVKAI